MASEQDQETEKVEEMTITSVIKTYTNKVVQDISGNVY